MDVQVRILQIDRHFGAFTPDGGKERLADIQIERVAEFILPGGAVCLDAGSQIARIVAPETALAKRAQQILQGLEAQKIERFVRNLEFDLALLARARSGG